MSQKNNLYWVNPNYIYCQLNWPNTIDWDFGIKQDIIEEIIGEIDRWVTEEDICKVLLWNEKPISVVAPTFVDLEITQTDPGVKGDTATGGSKPATLSTGAVIKVPLFVSEGEIVTIDTRSGEYQGRK